MSMDLTSEIRGLIGSAGFARLRERLVGFRPVEIASAMLEISVVTCTIPPGIPIRLETDGLPETPPFASNSRSFPPLPGGEGWGEGGRPINSSAPPTLLSYPWSRCGTHA